jgi:hypothetical protein
LGGFNRSSQHLKLEVLRMGAGKRQQAIRAMRGQMWSPGRPSAARREDRVRFWQAIARGVSSEDAAAVVGVSQAVGSRRFRHAGGMPPIMLALWVPRTSSTSCDQAIFVDQASNASRP